MSKKRRVFVSIAPEVVCDGSATGLLGRHVLQIELDRVADLVFQATGVPHLVHL